MKVRTNRAPRPIINGFELSEKEKAEFDYLEEEEFDSFSFFRYRGDVYYLGNFMRCEITEAGITWDGYAGDSYFSGTFIKLVDDCESVIVGTYIE